MTKSTAAARAGEFFDYVIEVLVGRDKHVRVDMRPVLGRVEDMLATHRVLRAANRCWPHICSGG
ncbi:hypothetical protein MCAG_00829 [Micromonospora sp. ATCC 39149]|nr:hypothetical protein MCAG_00829 [Micromonospora sp. ATCC 39149]